MVNPTETNIASALSSACAKVEKLLQCRLQYVQELLKQYSILSDNDDDLWGDGDALDSLVAYLKEWNQRKSKLKLVVEDTLTCLKSLEPAFKAASPKDKSQFCLLNGKTLNAIQPEQLCQNEDDTVEDYTGQAIEWLTRALKFDPQCAEAWCELGESCWRQGNPTEAANHFRQALKIEPHHVESHCQLSMALRQIAPSKSIKTDDQPSIELNDKSAPDLFTESLQLAHEAVRLAPSNGTAWSVLGNALLTAYFQSFSGRIPVADKESPQLIMRRCVAAYSQAAKDEKTVSEPNFHYNRGIAWHYQGMFNQSLRSWLRAMCLDSQWVAPRNNACRLTEFIREADRWLSQIRESTSPNDLSKSSHRLKHQIRELIEPLSPCLALTGQEKSTESDSNAQSFTVLSRLLGPYTPSSKDCAAAAATVLKSDISHNNKKKKRQSKVKSTVQRYPLASSKLKFTPFNELQLGQNKDMVCVGRVLTQLPSDTDLVLNFILIDPFGSPICLRLCNVGKGLGPITKDILAIPHPLVEECTVNRCLLSAVSKFIRAHNSADLDHLTDRLTTMQPTDADLTEGELVLRILRVPIPDLLVVNGQPIGSRWTAAPVLRSIFFTSV